ncbi:MAG: ABC transporter permease [Spirochaetales bacterium]|nr:ABC transporter permease [Spirochaetales bacterium]
MESFGRAFQLIFSGNREVFTIVFTSLYISIISTGVTACLGIPAGILLHFNTFPFKRGLVAVINALLALPTVVVGLLVFSLISRSGPLGSLNILFSPWAIVMGQVVLSFPIMVSLVYSGLSKVDGRFYETLVTLGAKGRNVLAATLIEARFVILSAVLAGFGRVIGEVGVSMMLGGNIRWYTRTMTTSIALESSKGEFSQALALGVILVTIALLVNGIIHTLVKER